MSDSEPDVLKDTPPVSESEVEEDVEPETPEMITKAIQFMQNDKFVEAAEIWSSISEQRASKYGEMAYECVDPYILYGESLLKHAQSKAEIFAKLNKAIEKKLNPNDAHDEDEEDDLEIVYRCFKMSEDILLSCLKTHRYPLDEKHIKSKLFRLYNSWAEYYLESDNFDDAIDVYTKSLNYTIEENDLADVHLQLAFAYMNIQQDDRGIAEYEQAQKYLEKKVSSLESKVKDSTILVQDVSDRIKELKDDFIKAVQEKKKEEEMKKKMVVKEGEPVNVLIPRKKEDKRKNEDSEDSNKKQKIE